MEDGARKIQEAANKPTLAAPDGNFHHQSWNNIFYRSLCGGSVAVNQQFFSLPGLKGVIAVNRPLRAGYVPADHHAQPLRWARNSLPAEPGQFADADE